MCSIFIFFSKHETFSNLRDAFLLFSSLPGVNPSLLMLSSCNSHYRHRHHHHCLQLLENHYQMFR
jgi:hypothetical protein